MKKPLKSIDKNLVPMKKNPTDFVQITRGYLSDIGKLARRSPIACDLLHFLTQRMTRQNAIVVSQSTLAEVLNCSKASITTAVNLLRTENWIQVVKIGQSNGYLVNSRVAWRSHQEKRYGHFGADVIVSETEQNQTVEELENQPLKHIPNVKVGEMMISDNADLEPPDQRDLIAPDFGVVPHIKKQ